jgi:hypothetical protein
LQTLSQGPKTCSEFLQIAKSIADQLAATGNPVPDEELISFVLNGLNPPFTSFITTYSFATREHQISFGDFQDELLSHEMLLNQQQTKVTDSSTFALTAQRPANPQLSKGKGPMYPLARHAPRGYPKEPAMAFNPGLLITNTVGVLTLITIRSLHSLSSCILPISSILNQTCSTTRGHCNLVTTTLAGHLILVFYLHLKVIPLATIQEFHRMDYAYQGKNPPAQLAAMVAHTNAAYEEPQWLADSGANAHITSDLENLHIQQPFQHNDEVAVGNGTGLTIESTGSSLIHTPTSSFQLNNILHCPQASANLLSKGGLLI